MLGRVTGCLGLDPGGRDRYWSQNSMLRNKAGEEPPGFQKCVDILSSFNTPRPT